MSVLYSGARDEVFMAIIEELAERGVGTFYSDVCDAVNRWKVKEVQI
jgi:hypothetical protein